MGGGGLLTQVLTRPLDLPTSQGKGGLKAVHLCKSPFTKADTTVRHCFVHLIRVGYVARFS